MKANEKKKKGSVRRSDQRRVCVSARSRSTFPTLPSLPGLVGAVSPAASPARSRLLFPGKRGRSRGRGTGTGQRRIPRKPRPPFIWLCPGSSPARKPPPPHPSLPRRAAPWWWGNIWAARAANIWVRPRRIPRRAQLEGPAAAGARPGRQRNPSEGGEGLRGRRRKRRRGSGAAEVRAARLPLAGVGGGEGLGVSPAESRVKAGQGGWGGWGVFNIPGWKDNSYSMFALTRSMGGWNSWGEKRGRDFYIRSSFGKRLLVLK